MHASSQDILGGNRGQIVLEYVFLLVIGVAVAALITNTMVSRDPANPGFVIRKWLQIIQTIGDDTTDDLKKIN